LLAISPEVTVPGAGAALEDIEFLASEEEALLPLSDRGMHQTLGVDEDKPFLAIVSSGAAAR
jgi:hypothetical protein